MPKYTTADIRNLAIVGSPGAGKTTLVEHMLNVSGMIGRIGRVEDKNTVCDYDDLEREMGHSLDSAVVHLDHAGKHLNIIDAPGASDFLGKAVSSLPAVETVVIVIDAAAGIDPVIRRLMKVSADRNIPRLIVINKIDNAENVAGLLDALRESFGTECQPINLPTGGGTGVIDCFTNTDGDSDLGGVGDFHTGIVDQVVEVDEALMEKYLESGSVDPGQLHDAFCRAMREAHLFPVCFTSAREGVGVNELMDVCANMCPSPLEGNRKPFTHGGEAFVPDPDPSKPLVAHAFKVSSDPYVGRLCVFRVHQGTMSPSVSPRINDGKKGVRVGHVFKLQGKEHSEEPEIIAGDIGAVAKIDEITYDATLHTGEIAEDLHIVPVTLSKPMFGLAIEGTSKGAETKLGDALRKLVAEDPTLEYERIQTTGETVLRGLGEQHLRVKLRLLKDRYGVEVDTKPPKVAYKETISAQAEGHHRHKKQTGGAGQFGEVYLRVEPITSAEDGLVDGLLFDDATFGGSIPKQFMPAVEKGVRQVMHDGAIAGYPLQNIKVSVYDGKHHPVDSKEVAFITAGKKAFVDAIQKAKPVLLEPFVHLEVTVPADIIGDISSDISGRRGRIQGTDMLPGGQAIVTVEVPLAEVMSYSSQLKSMSAGAGSYTMEYSHDEPTPANVQAEIIKAFKPRVDED